MSYTYKRMPEHLRAAWEAFETTLEPAIDLYGDCGRRKEAYARIRTELKLAQKAGIIPAFCKFSVRTDHNSLYVDLVQWQGRVFSDEYTEYLMDGFAKVAMRYTSADFDRGMHGNGRDLPRLVRELEDVGVIVAYIANRHNFDKSDHMTDYFHVGYYLNVETRDIEHIAERALRLESDPTFAALHAEALDAIRALHPDCRKRVCESVFGRGGFENAGEWSMNDIIRISSRAQGKPLAYDKRSRGWRVVTDRPGIGTLASGEV